MLWGVFIGSDDDKKFLCRISLALQPQREHNLNESTVDSWVLSERLGHFLKALSDLFFAPVLSNF